MDIYKARELQKILFKASNVEHKRMRTIIRSDGTLAYTVVHSIPFHESYRKIMDMDIETIIRMFLAVKSGVEVAIEVITENNRELLGVSPYFPNGFLIREIIEVD